MWNTPAPATIPRAVKKRKLIEVTTTSPAKHTIIDPENMHGSITDFVRWSFWCGDFLVRAVYLHGGNFFHRMITFQITR